MWLIENMYILTNCLEIVELDYSGWSAKNYHETFDLQHMPDNCERIDVNTVMPDYFVEKYEKLYKPVVITGVCDTWKAQYNWTLDVSIF